jgi:hypothetical protein
MSLYEADPEGNNGNDKPKLVPSLQSLALRELRELRTKVPIHTAYLSNVESGTARRGPAFITEEMSEIQLSERRYIRQVSGNLWAFENKHTFGDQSYPSTPSCIIKLPSPDSVYFDNYYSTLHRTTKERTGAVDIVVLSTKTHNATYTIDSTFRMRLTLVDVAVANLINHGQGRCKGRFRHIKLLGEYHTSLYTQLGHDGRWEMTLYYTPETDVLTLTLDGGFRDYKKEYFRDGPFPYGKQVPFNYKYPSYYLEIRFPVQQWIDYINAFTRQSCDRGVVDTKMLLVPTGKKPVKRKHDEEAGGQVKKRTKYG